MIYGENKFILRPNAINIDNTVHKSALLDNLKVEWGQVLKNSM